MENKRLLKARANADVGAGKFRVAEGRNDRDSEGGGGGWGRPQIVGEIKTRDPLAVILAFYPGCHVRPNAEGTARNR